MKIALDTNVLVYAEGLNGGDRRRTILTLLAQFEPEQKVVPVNVLGELFNVLVRKGGVSGDEAKKIVMSWRDAARPTPTSEAMMLAAIDLAIDHKLVVWDALVLATAAAHDCRVVLSEDMQDGFAWSGLTVVDPFAEPPSPLLEGAVRS
jgi:predicted nucleic acid-binding protein